jgi:hypothetical protein
VDRVALAGRQDATVVALGGRLGGDVTHGRFPSVVSWQAGHRPQ